MFHRFKLSLAAAALFLVGTASAEVYKIDSEHSSVAFSIRHLVSRTSGNFHEFSGTINYDAEHPEKTHVEATIQVASIDTDNARRDGARRDQDHCVAGRGPRHGHPPLQPETDRGLLCPHAHPAFRLRGQ